MNHTLTLITVDIYIITIFVSFADYDVNFLLIMSETIMARNITSLLFYICNKNIFLV